MRLPLLATLVIAAGLGAPRPTAAQTANDLLGGRELHDVWIRINSRDWEQIRTMHAEHIYYPCDVEWRGLRVRNAGCRSRGESSHRGVQPWLKIEFDYYVSSQTFLGLRSVTLDTVWWKDPSMFRERLSKLLFDRMGLPAPRESRARIYVGSAREYWGVYAVVEDVDAQTTGS
jgi:hypothetical protein